MRPENLLEVAAYAVAASFLRLLCSVPVSAGPAGESWSQASPVRMTDNLTGGRDGGATVVPARAGYYEGIEESGNSRINSGQRREQPSSTSVTFGRRSRKGFVPTKPSRGTASKFVAATTLLVLLAFVLLRVGRALWACLGQPTAGVKDAGSATPRLLWGKQQPEDLQQLCSELGEALDVPDVEAGTKTVDSEKKRSWLDRVLNSHKFAVRALTVFGVLFAMFVGGVAGLLLKEYIQALLKATRGQVS